MIIESEVVFCVFDRFNNRRIHSIFADMEILQERITGTLEFAPMAGVWRSTDGRYEVEAIDVIHSKKKRS